MNGPPRARREDILYTPEGKIDLAATMRGEREAQLARETATWEHSQRPLTCELCGLPERAHAVRREAFPICRFCSTEGWRTARRLRLPPFGFADLETDALVDDLSVVVGLLWSEARAQTTA
jgi:hypothetical protein